MLHIKKLVNLNHEFFYIINAIEIINSFVFLSNIYFGNHSTSLKPFYTSFFVDRSHSLVWVEEVALGL